MADRLMLIETRAVAPFFKNGYVLGCEATREAVVIDPGDEVDDLLKALAKHRLQARQILLTHAHLDHVTGVAAAKRALDVPVWLHESDTFLYENVVQQGLMFGLRVEPLPKIDRFYAEHQKIEFGHYEITVHHTPGHCPGGVCLAAARKETLDPRTHSPTDLFVGDTLFAGSIGRTDLPGGDTETLLRSIREVLFAFPDDSPVYSGHGEVTTIGRERLTNPFLR